MKKSILLFIMVMLISGCSQFGRQQSSSVTGVIKNKDNEPLAGVTVSCQSRVAVSTANGTYVLERLDPGVSTITALKTGYVNYIQSVDLDSGDNLVDLELQYSYYNYALSGTISDQAGNPVNDVYVCYVPSGSVTPLVWDRTDIRGSYRLPYVQRGEGTLRIEHSDYVSFSTSIILYNADKTYNTKLTPLTKGDGWISATGTAGWSARDGHASVAFGGKMWVIGGNDGSLKNDVWCSEDGITWECTVANAPWSPRSGHASVIFGQRMWVIGGDDGSLKNDVWYSADGVDWYRATANAAWSPRSGVSVIVTGNTMLISGGYDGAYASDVWSSTNGKTWTKKADASWAGRDGHQSVYFKSKIWVLGGNNDYWDGSDVWNSSNGIAWTYVNTYNPWSGRYLHSAVVYDNKIWVLGGTNSSLLNDIWTSDDGINWSQLNSAAEWEARRGHTSLVFDNKIWILGGNTGAAGRVNDVWYSE